MRAVWLVVAVGVAALLVSVVTIDLGPGVRRRAEIAGSKWIARPLHIGRLGLNLGRGRLVVEDLRSTGLTPGARPVAAVAGHVELSLTWRALLDASVLHRQRRDARLDRSSSRAMPDGRQQRAAPQRPAATAADRPAAGHDHAAVLRATRGRLLVRDFGSSWGIDAPNLEVEITKGDEYRGTMRFADGTLLIQQYEPMWRDFTTAFALRDGKVVLEQMALDGRRPQSQGTGTVDAGAVAGADLPGHLDDAAAARRARSSTPATPSPCTARATSPAPSTSIRGGYEVNGEFASPEVGYDDYRFRTSAARSMWVPDRLDVTARPTPASTAATPTSPISWRRSACQAGGPTRSGTSPTATST